LVPEDGHALRGYWRQRLGHPQRTATSEALAELIEGRTRDLAMFNLSIDSKLRGCDVVAIRVEDVAAANMRRIAQRSDRRKPAESSEQTRQAIDDYLKVANKRLGEFLFTGRLSPKASMTTGQYARLVCKIGVHFAGHLNVRPGTGAIASGRL
jgi:integrase